MPELVKPKKPYTVVMQIVSIIESDEKEKAEMVMWRAVSIGAGVCGNVQVIGCEAQEMPDEELRKMGIDPTKLRTH